jgi:uncharacterized membrane protein YagU involved in acid resistance
VIPSTGGREKTMDVRIGRAIVAGLVGTLVMTAVGLWVAPLMGIPPMNPAEMLAGAMGGSLAAGWAGHLMIGTVLALGYAVVERRLPGSPPVRGALYALAPFLMAQLLVMPMMGMPVFSGSVAMAMGSLIGHLVYGAVVGAIYGTAQAEREPMSRPESDAPPADADFSDLRALFINCTLKRAPVPSHTRGLMDVSRGDSRGEPAFAWTSSGPWTARFAPGIYPDMTEHGWERDDWPGIYEQVKTSTSWCWALRSGSARSRRSATKVIERLYGNLRDAQREGSVRLLRSGGRVHRHRQRGRGEALPR